MILSLVATTLTALLTAGSPDELARAEVDRLLAEMAAAVRAADADGYLRRVDRSDPVFAREQANWAADLAKNPVAEFALSVGEGGLTLVEGGARAELVMTWRLPAPPAADGEPPREPRERRVAWPARFVKGADGWLYAGEAWNVHEAPGVVVFYEDGLDQAAALVADLMPHVRQVVHAEFEVEDGAALTGRVQQIKLYQSMAHLQASIYLSYTDSLGGWNEPGESIKLLARPNTTRRSIENRLAHEYGHVATFELGPHATDMPWWVLEGIANHVGTAATGTGDPSGAVRRWARAGTLADWDDLARFDQKGRSLGRYVYAQGQHMVAYITERFGLSRRNEWMRAMAQGASLDEAARRVLGLSFADLDAQWRQDLADQIAREAPEPDPPPRSSPVP